MFISKCVFGYLGHESAVRTPGVVIRSLSDLRLHLGVVHDHIGPVEREEEGVERGRGWREGGRYWITA